MCGYFPSPNGRFKGFPTLSPSHWNSNIINWTIIINWVNLAAVYNYVISKYAMEILIIVLFETLIINWSNVGIVNIVIIANMNNVGIITLQ